ncbi:MAG: hypothetical protein GYA21_15535 [Myxococcales bacterium]|nr:hypothetical protein [Myxococcales bacterium]
MKKRNAPAATARAPLRPLFSGWLLRLTAAFGLALLFSAPAQARRVYEDPNSYIGLDLGQRFSPDVVDPFVFPTAGFFGSIRLWDELVARLNVDVGYSRVLGSPLGSEDAHHVIAGLIFDIIWAIPVGRGPEFLVGGRLGYRYSCLWADHDLRPAGSTGNVVKVGDAQGYAFGALLGILLPLQDTLSLSVEARIEYCPISLLDQTINGGGYSVHASLWWRYSSD